MDEKRNPVHLDYVDFIKIYTGQLQQIDPLGGISRLGMGGVIDLHPDALVLKQNDKSYKTDYHDNNITIAETNGVTTVTNIYNIMVVVMSALENRVSIYHICLQIYTYCR